MRNESKAFPITRKSLSFSLLLAIGLVTPALATAITPSDDTLVLEVLPRSWQAESAILKRLRQQWQAQPNQADTAERLARHYIERGREQADSRYYGYAEAVLKPWANDTTIPANLLLLRATLNQQAHHYEQALQELNQLVQQHPNHTQGWLTLAVIQTVRGDYQSAQQSCKQLAETSAWYASLCLSQVLSLTGQAESAYQLQTQLLTSLKPEQVELRQWLNTLLGETAWRLGETKTAQQHFQAALAEPRSDHYLLRVYSDYLLTQQRPQEVVELLKDKLSDDALLLRMVLASQALQQSAETQRYQQQLEARYAAARLRGSQLHERDEVLYLLTFQGDPARALVLAKANWSVQKETEDTQLLLRAALANKDYATAQQVRAWLIAQKQQDIRLKPLLDQLATQTAEAKP